MEKVGKRGAPHLQDQPRRRPVERGHARPVTYRGAVHCRSKQPEQRLGCGTEVVLPRAAVFVLHVCVRLRSTVGTHVEANLGQFRRVHRRPDIGNWSDIDPIADL